VTTVGSGAACSTEAMAADFAAVPLAAADFDVVLRVVVFAGVLRVVVAIAVTAPELFAFHRS